MKDCLCVISLYRYHITSFWGGGGYVVLGITGHNNTRRSLPIIITYHSSINTAHTPPSHFIRANQPHDFILHSRVSIHSCTLHHNTCTNVFTHKLHLIYHNTSYFSLSLHSYQITCSSATIFLTSVYRERVLFDLVSPNYLIMNFSLFESSPSSTKPDQNATTIETCRSRQKVLTCVLGQSKIGEVYVIRI